jgi:lipid-A-disaccharide synthase
MRRVGIVAGETSGDRLGAGLIAALRRDYPDLIVEGVAGPRMIEAGCQPLYPMERLAVMGVVEVLKRYRELHGMRRRLIEHFLANPPDVFIGVDAPEFNLDLELALRQAGVRTVHYVSPQVWAWREGRLAKIAKAVDRMLVLFPFEERYYQEHGIPVRFVGHPLADEIPLTADKKHLRETLDLPEDGPIVALLPGSRANEWRYHIEPFIQTARWLKQRTPQLNFAVAAVNAKARQRFEEALGKLAPELAISIHEGRTREVLGAADVVLTVSGTATLETLLMKRPMVVAYRMGWLSYSIARLLVRVSAISLPNLLSGRQIVPELIQGDVRPERLGQAVLDWLEHPEQVSNLESEFIRIHHALRQNADEAAAQAVREVVDGG